jgi:hypothetical protein
MTDVLVGSIIPDEHAPDEDAKELKKPEVAELLDIPALPLRISSPSFASRYNNQPELCSATNPQWLERLCPSGGRKKELNARKIEHRRLRRLRQY